jgi:polysaccharide biosynthesis/export protein
MRARNGWGGIALAIAMLATAGCTMFPAAGPESWDVRAGRRNPESLSYAQVKITPAIIDTLAKATPRLSVAFQDRRPPKDTRFGTGDVVSVSVFEAAAGGLFIPVEAGVRPGNFITLPNQNVDGRGNISIPYGGRIRASGRTAAEVEDAIIDALRKKAIEPQAVVSLVDQRTSLISVLGEVNTPSRLPASAAGEHILDAITRAGGPRGQGFDNWVMLEREGRREIVPFGSLVNEPANNIFAHPDDTIYLYREPQTFLVFGAFGAAGVFGGSAAQGQFEFGAWRLSLAEAIAKAGGLLDNTADPGSVFLYRGETRSLAEQLGVEVGQFSGPIVPVIYNIDLRDPAGYFLATKFQMRNKDVIFASNAASAEQAKVMTYLRLLTGTVNDPIVTATNAYALRAAIRNPP